MHDHYTNANPTFPFFELKLVRKICEYLQQGYGNTEIAKKLNVKLCVVTGIKTRRNYTIISKDYIW